MNDVRLKGTIKFPPRVFSAGVGVVIQPEGESAGVDCTCWSKDAPEAAALLGKAQQGDTVSVLGKVTRSKEKRLAKLDGQGNLQSGDVYVASIAVLKARVDAAAQRPAPRDDSDIPF